MDNLKSGTSVHPDTIKKTTTERGKLFVIHITKSYIKTYKSVTKN